MKRGARIPARPSAQAMGKAFGMLRARKRAGFRNPKPQTPNPESGNGIGNGNGKGSER